MVSPITVTNGASEGTGAAGPIHPGWLRATHWFNALAVVVMVASGWRIYDASPLYTSVYIPKVYTMGGGLAGATQWHFAAMWLLVVNGLAYLTASLAAGRLRQKFLPLSATALWTDLRAAFQGRLSHADPRHYNALQRVAYLAIIAVLVSMVLSGLAMWKSVQLSLLVDTMGGYEAARRIHFWAMAAIVAFVVGHVTMVALVPRSLLTMIRGR